MSSNTLPPVSGRELKYNNSDVRSLKEAVLRIGSGRADVEFLLDRNLELPRTREEEMELEHSTKDSVLSTSDEVADNFKTILRLFITEALKIKEQQYEQEQQSKLHNAMVVLRVIMKHWVEQLSSDQLRERFEEAESKEGQDSRPSTPLLAKSLLQTLIEMIIYMPLETLQEYQLSSEAVGILVILCSAQLKTAQPDAHGDFFLSICVRELPEFARPLQLKLLQHYSDQLKPRNAPGLIGSALNMFFSSKKSYADPQLVAALAEKSVLLLLLMAFQDTREDLPNPFRDAIVDWGVAEVNPSYADLFGAVCSKIEANEETALLVYLLVYRNDQFRSYILSLTEPESLLLPLLKTIYRTIGDNPSYSHLYMLLIILLLLSQDDVFASRSHQIQVPAPIWFTERQLKSVSLGDFIVLVLIKTLLGNLGGGRDLFFHSNCLAALANFSRFSVNMSAYVAQRLVGLFDTAARRWSRSSETSNEHAIYEDLMSIVLEIVSAVLSTNLHHNPHLVYAVLLRRDTFLQHRSNPRFADLVENINLICNYFQGKIDDANLKATSADEILAVIVLFSKQWSPRTLKTFPELRFQYEAKSEFRTFFLPYVWSLAFRTITTLEWDIDHATLTHQFLEEHGVSGTL